MQINLINAEAQKVCIPNLFHADPLRCAIEESSTIYFGHMCSENDSAFYGSIYQLDLNVRRSLPNVRAEIIRHNLITSRPTCLSLGQVERLTIPKGFSFNRLKMSFHEFCCFNSTNQLVFKTALLASCVFVSVLYVHSVTKHARKIENFFLRHWSQLQKTPVKQVSHYKPSIYSIPAQKALPLPLSQPPSTLPKVAAATACLFGGALLTGGMYILAREVIRYPFYIFDIDCRVAVCKLFASGDAKKNVSFENLSNEKVEHPARPWYDIFSPMPQEAWYDIFSPMPQEAWYDIISAEEISKEEIKSPSFLLIGNYVFAMQFVLKRLLSKALMGGRLMHPIENRPLTEGEEEKLITDVCSVFCIEDKNLFKKCWTDPVLIDAEVFWRMDIRERDFIIGASYLIRFMDLLPLAFRATSTLDLIYADQKELMPKLEMLLRLNESLDGVRIDKKLVAERYHE